MITKATLTVQVVYEGPDATGPNIRDNLDYLVRYAVGNGMLSSGLEAVATTWSHSIEVETRSDSESKDEDNED